MPQENAPHETGLGAVVKPQGCLSTSSEVRRGIIASLPMMIGFAPFGLVLGAQAQQKGFSVLGVSFLTGVNFAGGSEFAALELWTWPPHIFLIVAVTLLVNCRHILMSAVLAPLLNHLPKRKVLPALFFMCDESWAIALADAGRKRENPAGSKGQFGFSLPFYLGVAVSLYCTWVAFTTLGAIVGPLIGDVRNFGFDMAFPAVFFVLLKGMWKNVTSSLPWVVSLVVALLTYVYVPGAWYVLAGALSGIVAAFFLPEAR